MKKTRFLTFAMTFVLSFLMISHLYAQEMCLVEINCENLFDCEDDSLKDDDEFLPQGTRMWTPGRYWKKLNHIGQEILSCGEAVGSDGVPDLVVLCEVENDSVVFDLTRRSLLRNAGYEYFITDSPDKRGIDVALLYSPFTFSPLNHHSIRIEPLKGMRPTRDILYVSGLVPSGDTLHVFAVHTPSRSGGEMETRPNRRVVAERLIQEVDSIRKENAEARIIIAGDFNDYNDSPAIKYIVKNGLVDVSADAKGINGAKGTYKFQGEWGSLDHIFVSKPLAGNVKDCRINDAEFLLTEDKTYGGKQPFRCYEGIKWRNGFSDHLPLVVRIV